MRGELLFRLAADALLALHAAFVAFVVLGLLAIFVGGARRWRWVRARRLRTIHLAAIGFVVIQAWLGLRCPFTAWEMALRARAGDATYAGDFVQHWLQAAIYYTAPTWVFIAAYTVFGALVLASWFLVPPMPAAGASERPECGPRAE